MLKTNGFNPLLEAKAHELSTNTLLHVGDHYLWILASIDALHSLGGGLFGLIPTMLSPLSPNSFENVLSQRYQHLLQQLALV